MYWNWLNISKMNDYYFLKNKYFWWKCFSLSLFGKYTSCKATIILSDFFGLLHCIFKRRYICNRPIYACRRLIIFAARLEILQKCLKHVYIMYICNSFLPVSFVISNNASLLYLGQFIFWSLVNIFKYSR